ncbi:MAG: hypothetical protein IJK48_06240 [Bacteroidales bacterium]|nr:hypothetical protein [Bacteroidales bacterium]
MAEYYEDLTFVKRTKKLIKENVTDYEASLLVNCAIGLLFIAKEKYGDTLSKVKDPKIIRQWGIDPDAIECCKKYDYKTRTLKDESRTLRAIVRHLRNSFAHCNFKPINSGEKIIGYKIADFYVPSQSFERASLTFKTDIKLEDLRKFMGHVAGFVLSQKKKQNNKIH